MCLGKRNEQQREGGRKEKSSRRQNCCPKLSEHNEANGRTCCPPSRGPLLLLLLHSVFASSTEPQPQGGGGGVGESQNGIRNGKMFHVLRHRQHWKRLFLAINKRTHALNTHTHTHRNTHALTYTHITHTPRSTSNSSSILRSWQHIQSGKKQQQKSFHRLPFYIKKLKQTNRKIKAKKQKKPSCALYWLRTLPLPKVPPVINYRYHHRTQVSSCTWHK